ncbi:hypothetical protein [Porphyrobacter sp. ULC335]|uniref:hypothetical protein n=1 Tax=Porphyrobacter sp. ULC335 TaxID=2854260 RepID=UPI00221ED9EC|nr:hypothetical protein [Porphyrobacter sp. ULC335]UYV14449.1 hypothetical protein KVF90_09740 [Porphyrobacter sp. ULC335]
MPNKAYYITPIDFGWEYLPSVHEFANRMAKLDVEIKLARQPYGEARLDKFLADFAKAQELADEVGWEGDFRGDPCVFCLPIENEIVYGFVWKQENNGDTLVITPEPMPWLDHLVLT